VEEVVAELKRRGIEGNVFDSPESARSEGYGPEMAITPDILFVTGDIKDLPANAQLGDKDDLGHIWSPDVWEPVWRELYSDRVEESMLGTATRVAARAWSGADAEALAREYWDNSADLPPDPDPAVWDAVPWDEIAAELTGMGIDPDDETGALREHGPFIGDLLEQYGVI